MMQKNPAPVAKVAEGKEPTRKDAVLRKIHSIFLENWGTKLLALLIAVALWAGLITQDPDLTREKVFTDVSVNVVGSDTLRRNGFIVLEDVAAVLDDVSVRVSVPQGQYTSAATSNYSIRIDLSRIRATGTQEVRILSTNSSTYGAVISIDPPSVTLTVDEYVTSYRIPVTVECQGEAPAGYFAQEPSTDPPTVAVSGPKSLVEQIASARVIADQTLLPAKEGVVRRATPFVLEDVEGRAIESELLQVTSESVLLDSIIVEQNVFSRRVVELDDLGLVKGTPAEGYEIKGVYITPGSIEIAGRASTIDSINLLYADGSVDVTGLTESVNKALRVRQPSTLRYLSTDTVTVAVEIGPVITSRAYEAQVALTGLASSLREVGGLRMATVHLTGPQPWLDSLTAKDVTLTCDLSTIPAPGTYTMPLVCQVEGSQGQSYTCDVVPSSVVVTVIER